MNRHSESSDAVPKLRDRIREATLEAIFQAAERVFADEGPTAARMETVAAQAGVSVGTLYNYVEDKQSLINALLSARRGDLLEQLDAVLKEESGQPFRHQLHSFFALLLEYFERHKNFLALCMQLEHSKGEKRLTVPQWQATTMGEVFMRCERLVKIGLKEKALRPPLADLLPIFLMGITRSTLAAQMIRDSDSAHPIPRPKVEQMVQFFLSGAGT